MVEPSRSAGNRSGVNCTRVNCRPSAAAKDLAISVFPRPGRSSMRMWPRARTVVRMSRSAERFPTTTRSISSRIASQWAVVVAAGSVMFGSRLLSYLLQLLQNVLQRRAARTGLVVTAARDVVGIDPFPQLHTEEHAPGCVVSRRIFGLPLTSCHLVATGEHGAQVPVPVGPGGLRPPDRRLGRGKPAAQRISEIVGVRLGGGIESVRQGTAKGENHQSQPNARSRQYQLPVMLRQREQFQADDEANAQSRDLLHAELHEPSSSRTN